MKLLTILLACAFYVQSFAATSIATATMVRGDVTVLPPSAKAAKKLKKGDQITQDSSILVNGKGVAKIRFTNNSSVVLGPDSKMVVNLDKQDATSLISLVNGKIRAAVKKQNSTKHKMIVKNNSSVMGVRGTTFQVTYDGRSSRSSLLTFTGTVDMTKARKTTATAKEIKKELAIMSKPITRGKFCNVTKKGDLLEPVYINSTQFVALEKNENFSDQKPSAQTIVEIKKEAAILAKEFKNKSADKKDLGLIDPKTGLYLPPTKDAKLFGGINSTGEYVAPKGVTIDPVQGPVAINQSSSKLKEALQDSGLDMGDQTNLKSVDNQEVDGYRRYFINQ